MESMCENCVYTKEVPPQELTFSCDCQAPNDRETVCLEELGVCSECNHIDKGMEGWAEVINKQSF
jgi:hypothetical protein